MYLPTITLLLALLAGTSMAQFFNFGNMFHNQHQQQAEPQNMPSDSDWYQGQYEGARCDKYLCPHTLSYVYPYHKPRGGNADVVIRCVHFPHHCPCAFPQVEDKVEFGEGSMACVSKGGYKAGEAARKIELARKGLL